MQLASSSETRARLAWQTVLEVYRAALDRDDVVPGAAAAIQTFGQLVHWHPHVHALVTEGAFTPDGVFVPLPPVDDEPFVRLFREKVFDLLLRKGRIDDRIVRQMRGWRHSGFRVNRSVRLAAGDTKGLERCLVRCPFSLSRVIRVSEEGKILYRAEKTECRRFPGGAVVPARGGANAELFGGVSRNFQVFDPLDFLAD